MKKSVIFSVMLCWSAFVLGQGVKFTASADRAQVGKGEQFEVSFSLNANADKFAPPDFSGLEVLAGPNMSSSMTSVNGNTSMSIGYSYVLVATREGNYTIGAATAEVNGRRYSTQPLKIQVVNGRPTQQSRNARRDDEPEALNADLSKELFIRAVVDKSTVYQGEQLTLSYRLYTRIPLLNSEAGKIPDLNGFWSQEIASNGQNTQWRKEVYKGVAYNVADIKQSILFPEHSGKLVIDPLEMIFMVRQQTRPRDMMEEFFGSYKEARVIVKSAPVTITAKPLPEAGKPEGFSGAVGKFWIEASADKKALKTNEALNYKVKITGSGNLKLLKDLPIEFPEDFEKYDPKLTDKISESLAGVSGSRTYEYLLIPRHEGNFTIGPKSFSYFNPYENKYVTLPISPSPVKVNKGKDEGNVTALAGGQQDVKLLDKDIRYIKTGDTEPGKAGEGWYGSGLFYFLLSVGPIAIAAALLYRKWDERNNSDPVRVKSRLAGKLASKHLASAQARLAAGQQREFYDDLFKGLYGYLANKLNIPYAGLNRENIADSLNARAVDAKLVRSLQETLDLCEMARYSPVQGISPGEVFEKSKKIIADIEGSI
ncbi:BatD family protein [Hufsiella ginkgonis]|uniref:Protein BatD n=1 Tax=Hufsiella ginkgonis TaxID=2695274 RepID=A0A7K1XYA6_9SPHI|nr:BatD family protein [Hufsiella ginkgonis]MXV15729.1 protein BatD [Hufsiella ginkgonis]